MRRVRSVGAVGAFVLLSAIMWSVPACRRTESCKSKCARQVKECDPNADVSSCIDLCEAQDAALGGACGAPFQSLLDCIDGLPSTERCADGGAESCSAYVEDVLLCCDATPNAVGCESGSCSEGGQPCQLNADCCENFCASDGFCGCIPPQVSGCVSNIDCCSGACDMVAGVCS